MASAADIKAALAPLGHELIGAGEVYDRNDSSLAIAKSGVRIAQRGVGKRAWLHQDWELTLYIRKSPDDEELDAAALGIWNALRTAGIRLNPDSPAYFDASYGETGTAEFREMTVAFTTTEFADV